MDKLELLRLGEEYLVTKVDENEYRVSEKNGDLCAFIRDDKSIEYCVGGVYNSGSEYVDIEMESLKKLEQFCNILIK